MHTKKWSQNVCFSWKKKNLVLKEKYFQYFMKIKGEIRPSFKQIPLQKCHKIFLHIFPFLNILHSFSLFQKKTYILITARGLAAYHPSPIYRLVRNLYIFFFTPNPKGRQSKFDTSLNSSGAMSTYLCLCWFIFPFIYV